MYLDDPEQNPGRNALICVIGTLALMALVAATGPSQTEVNYRHRDAIELQTMSSCQYWVTLSDGKPVRMTHHEGCTNPIHKIP